MKNHFVILLWKGNIMTNGKFLMFPHGIWEGKQNHLRWKDIDWLKWSGLKWFIEARRPWKHPPYANIHSSLIGQIMKQVWITCLPMCELKYHWSKCQGLRCERANKRAHRMKTHWLGTFFFFKLIKFQWWKSL